MKHKVITAGVALSFLALLAYGVSARVNQWDAGDRTTPHLEGTWRVTVTPPPGGPPPYIGFGSYTSGGVLITSPDPSVGPGVTSTGQGTWVRTGGNQFASTHVAFTYDSVGHITGTIRIKASYQLGSYSSATFHSTTASPRQAAPPSRPCTASGLPLSCRPVLAISEHSSIQPAQGGQKSDQTGSE